VTQITLDAYFDEIRSLLNEGQFKRAETHCRYILDSYPRSIQATRHLGSALLEQDDYEGAAELFGRVLEADPADFTALTGMGYASDGMGDEAGARGNFERASEVAPFNRVVVKELERLPSADDGDKSGQAAGMSAGALAHQYMRLGWHREAVVLLNELLAIDSTRADYQAMRAEALLRSGNTTGALQQCAEILQKHPKNLQANGVMAELFVTMDRKRKAVERLEQIRQALLPTNRSVDPSRMPGKAFADSGLVALEDEITIEKLDYRPLEEEGMVEAESWLTRQAEIAPESEVKDSEAPDDEYLARQLGEIAEREEEEPASEWMAEGLTSDEAMLDESGEEPFVELPDILETEAVEPELELADDGEDAVIEADEAVLPAEPEEEALAAAAEAAPATEQAEGEWLGEEFVGDAEPVDESDADESGREGRGEEGPESIVSEWSDVEETKLVEVVDETEIAEEADSAFDEAVEGEFAPAIAPLVKGFAAEDEAAEERLAEDSEAEVESDVIELGPGTEEMAAEPEAELDEPFDAVEIENELAGLVDERLETDSEPAVLAAADAIVAEDEGAEETAADEGEEESLDTFEFERDESEWTAAEASPEELTAVDDIAGEPADAFEEADQSEYEAESEPFADQLVLEDEPVEEIRQDADLADLVNSITSAEKEREVPAWLQDQAASGAEETSAEELQVKSGQIDDAIDDAIGEIADKATSETAELTEVMDELAEEAEESVEPLETLEQDVLATEVVEEAFEPIDTIEFTSEIEAEAEITEQADEPAISFPTGPPVPSWLAGLGERAAELTRRSEDEERSDDSSALYSALPNLDLADQIPDDPDEALAWFERLAREEQRPDSADDGPDSESAGD